MSVIKTVDGQDIDVITPDIATGDDQPSTRVEGSVTLRQHDEVIPVRRYSKDEDDIIKRHLREVDSRVHREVLARCRFVSENHLPHRTPEGIRERWYALIGKFQGLKSWENPLQDVAGLIDDDQRRRLKIRTTMPRIKKYIDPRVKRKAE